MSVKGEKYKTPAAKKKHEKTEPMSARIKEYGPKAAMKKTTKKAAPSKVAKIMGEFKAGTLHGGVNPKGPKKAAVVKSRKQALAIALSAARKKK
jgi:hypothetical protein